MENQAQEEKLKKHLLATDPTFRQLCEQHASYSRLVEAIENRLHLTEADEVEEQRLKKLKLSAKDRLNEVLARYKHASVA